MPPADVYDPNEYEEDLHKLDGCDSANIFDIGDVYDFSVVGPDLEDFKDFEGKKSGTPIESKCDGKKAPEGKQHELHSPHEQKDGKPESKLESKKAETKRPDGKIDDDGYVPDDEMPPRGGTLIYYDGGDSIPELGTHINDDRGVGVREDIVRECDDGLSKALAMGMAKGKPTWFMPTGVEDTNEYIYGKPKYALKLFGILLDGSKTEVLVRNIKVFFDIPVPDAPPSGSMLSPAGQARLAKIKVAADPVSGFRYNVENILEEAGMSKGTLKDGVLTSGEFAVEIVEAHRLECRAGMSKFLRVTTPTLQLRKKALKLIRDVPMETASDDRSCYYRKAAREHGIPLSSWGILTNFEWSDHLATTSKKEEDNYKYIRERSPLCAHHLRVNVENFKPVVDQLGTKAEREAAAARLTKLAVIARDRTLLLTWDIETREGRGTGDLPDASYDEDHVFAICMSAHWKDSTTALRQYHITDVMTAPTEGRTTIVCGNQRNVIKAFALVFRAVAPDIFTGFNDSNYDWPFLIEKYRKEKLLSWAWNKMSAAPDKRTEEEEVLKWKVCTDKKIKISPEETYLSTYMTIPGCVPIDMRACFKKLFPKSETPAKGSLKFYLKESKLPGKADMPYQRMNNYYDAALETEGEPDDESAEHVREYLHYCYIDAYRCQQLQVRRNVVNDGREVASLAFVSLFDSHYYAGGMKVCNLLGAYAWRRNILTSMQARERKEEGKYPGAYVFAPEKGLSPDPGRMGKVDELVKIIQMRDAAIKDKKGEPESSDEEIEPEPEPPSNATAGSFGNMSFDELIKLDKESFDALVRAYLDALAADRPVTGLDFSSLYPSIIMTYNLSPEKILPTPEAAKAWAAKGSKLHKIEFQFNGRTVRAWSILHENRQEDIGLFPAVLIDLFNRRAEVKVVLGKHGATKELIEGVHGNSSKLRQEQTLTVLSMLAAAEAEVARCDAALAPGAPAPKISPGATLSEELAELKRLRKNAAEQVEGFHKLLIDAASKNTNIHDDMLKGFMDECSNGNRSAFAELDLEVVATYEQACFNYTCANSKQNALKVFMNSFYGESGNSLSPFFLLPLAGGVTEAGRRNIQMVADFVRSRGYRIKYGDTDSLYLIPPNKCFEECDADYIAGRITREEWWEAMVRITMRALNQIRDEVNAFLKADNGCPYLKMAYEEVLYPVVFTGKKKYFGIPHLNEVNFRPKKLFIRGIDVVKQGQPELARVIGYDIMWQCMSLTNKLDLMSTVENVLRAAVTTKEWKFEDFIKTDAWKPLKKNIPVHRCIARMTVRHAAETAENDRRIARGEPPNPILYEMPESGERFSYVIVKTGTTFSLRGCKAAPKKGDRMMFATAARALGLEVDVAFYMISYVVGLCARFINSDPRFLPPIPTSYTEKKLDEATQKNAKKYLTTFIKSLSNTDAPMMLRRGYAYRRAYKAAAVTAHAMLVDIVGTMAAEVLHGEWLSYELLTLWCGDQDDAAEDEEPDEADDARPLGDTSSAAVDGMWAMAGSFADSIIAKYEAGWHRGIIEAYGMNADGLDIRDDGITSATTLVRLLKKRPNTDPAIASHLGQMEAAIRKRLTQMVPILSDMANRYEANLVRLTTERRAIEHAEHPEIGAPELDVANSPPAEEPALHGITEKDRQPLRDTLSAWFEAVAIQIVRRQEVVLYEQLKKLSNTLANSGLVTIRMPRKGPA